MSQSLNLTRNNLLGPRIHPSIEPGTSGRGLAASALLHASIIAATLFTFSQAKLEIEDQSPPVVPVDLVTIAQKTNIAPTVQEQPKAIQIQVQPPQADELQTKVPALPQQSEFAPPPEQATSEPALPKPRPVPLPKAKPQARPERETKKKKSEEDLSALLNKLTAPSAAPKNAKVASRTQRGFGDMNAMTMELRDALRNQIEQCMDWGPLADSPNARDIVVTVDLTLNADGSVAGVAPHATSGPYQSAAISAAMRAIHVCAPYKLPADQYATWRDSNVDFSPRDVLGQ
jgi:outer membrane biosynthesis protein TonB